MMELEIRRNHHSFAVLASFWHNSLRKFPSSPRRHPSTGFLSVSHAFRHQDRKC